MSIHEEMLEYNFRHLYIQPGNASYEEKITFDNVTLPIGGTGEQKKIGEITPCLSGGFFCSAQNDDGYNVPVELYDSSGNKVNELKDIKAFETYNVIAYGYASNATITLTFRFDVLYKKMLFISSE